MARGQSSSRKKVKNASPATPATPQTSVSQRAQAGKMAREFSASTISAEPSSTKRTKKIIATPSMEIR